MAMPGDREAVYPPMMGDPRQRARMLSALYLAQEQYGWLSPAALERVSERLGVKVGSVKSTASFYTMFRLEPRGEYHIQVCEGLSCFLVGGAEPILDHLIEKLGIHPGEVTRDGLFSLEVVQCLAACGSAPAVRVNDVLYEHVTPDSLRELIVSFREEGGR